MLHFLFLILAFPVLLPVAEAGAAGSGIAWRGWDAALREAKSKGRPVLVDVYTNWCGWCRRMDRDVYERADVRAYLDAHFVSVKLNAEAADPARYEGKAHTSRSLASRFRVTGYPTTVFLSASGGHLVNVPGYIPPQRFLLLLRFIGDGHYDRGESFQDFERASGGGL
ncbi:MAG TPA: thioredoxin fold domain-containing protein [Candidatus Limnocylindria bacterium]|nr:thioredoxin fold domain-containing protein [Candidatus Limnocylindria bacterium]